MQNLRYEAPDTVEGALAALADGNARPLAGGTDLVVQLREGRKAAGCIVDLKRIPELTAISRQANGGWRIGAAASFSRMAAHAELAADHPGLVASGRLVGSLQIQNRAGLGGNICNAAPSADAVPLVICLDGRAEIAGRDGRRQEPVERLFAGPGRTALAPGEVVLSILLPPLEPIAAARYLRFTPRREMDIAVAGAGAWISLATDGTIAATRITLASVAPVPLRAIDAERHLTGATPSAALFAEAGRIAAREARPISDTRGSADYRLELVAVLTRRALGACANDLKLGIDVS